MMPCMLTSLHCDPGQAHHGAQEKNGEETGRERAERQEGQNPQGQGGEREGTKGRLMF